MLATFPDHLGTVNGTSGEATGLQYCVQPTLPISSDQASPNSMSEPVGVPSLCFWRNSPPQWTMASSSTRFLDHTRRRITVGMTPLDEWSATRRDCLTKRNTHNRQTSMPPVGFEPTISAGERPLTYALDRAATGTVLDTLHSAILLERSFATCYQHYERYFWIFNTSVTAWMSWSDLIFYYRRITSCCIIWVTDRVVK